MKNIPRDLTFFFNDQIEINQPSNVKYTSALHFMYALRYMLTLPNIDHITTLATLKFPLDPRLTLASEMFRTNYISNNFRSRQHSRYEVWLHNWKPYQIAGASLIHNDNACWDP